MHLMLLAIASGGLTSDLANRTDCLRVYPSKSCFHDSAIYCINQSIKPNFLLRRQMQDELTRSNQSPNHEADLGVNKRIIYTVLPDVDQPSTEIRMFSFGKNNLHLQHMVVSP